MRRRLEASWHKTTKPCDLTATVNDAVAYTDVGKGREQDAEALRRENKEWEICLTCDRKLKQF
jgi:hypothetical protein